jgi:prepilin-type processing-associated H-X9-DG protein
LGNAQIDLSVSNIQNGVLYDYALEARVFHCPGDKSTVKSFPTVRRLRSYSLSGLLNGDGTAAGFPTAKAGTDPYIKAKYGQLLNPGEVFAFIDEHEQSIDSGLMVGYEPGHDTWWDLPSDRHNQGCSVSFADGRVLHWHWNFPKGFQMHGQSAASAAQDPQRKDLNDLRQYDSWTPSNE